MRKRRGFSVFDLKIDSDFDNYDDFSKADIDLRDVDPERSSIEDLISRLDK